MTNTTANVEVLLTPQLEKDMVSFRRELHQSPELSGEEFETAKKIQQRLKEYGIHYQTGYAGTGILGIIEGKSPGGVAALRADMDALPIQEKNHHSFVSEADGKMHACGHDAHTAMLITAGRILQQTRAEWSGTVLLLFQPAEEKSPEGGARKMMEDGVFADYQPDVIFGQHVWPDLPVGTIGVRNAEMMGASDRFTLTVRGAGGHASMPHQAVDAVTAAGHIIAGLQTIVSRNVDPLESAVVTVGKINGGYAHNVVADEVVLEGSVRTFKPHIKERVKNRFAEVAEGMARSLGAEADISYLDGYPATVNTPEWAEVVRSQAERVLGLGGVPEVAPSLGAEDFSRFLLKYPGCFYWLGTASPDGQNQRPLHDARFGIDESALAIGVKVMVSSALSALQILEEKRSAAHAQL